MKARGVAAPAVAGVAQAHDEASTGVEERDEDAEADVEMAHRSRREHAVREAASQTDAEYECVVCLDPNPTHIFVPCAHFCVCVGCCEDIMAKPAPQCPQCLCSAQACFKVFRP